MAKKVIVLFMVAVLLIMVSCTSKQPTGGEKGENEPPTQDTSTQDTSTQDTSAEPVVLRVIAAKHALTKDVTTFPFLKSLEERANVKIEWEQYVNSEWNEKKSVILSSGDVPDIFLGEYTITFTDIMSFKHLFVPLNDLIEQYAPNVKSMFEETPLTKELCTARDGNIYGLPRYQRIWPKVWNRQVINKAWLDKLNLPMPTTWDELYNVLKAFKTQDPNGNGKADEIPLNWAPGYEGFNVTVMLGGYGLLSSQYGSPQGYFVEDGKVKNRYADPRYKELIAFLHKLYKEDLINPQVFTDDYNAYKALGRSPEVPILGMSFGWDVPGVVGTEWADQYTIMPPLKPYADYDGPMYWDYSYYDLNYGFPSIAMTTKCENKEAAMRWMDLFYDPEVSLQVLFGSLDECIEKHSDGTYEILPPASSEYDPFTWKWINAFADQGPMNISPSLKINADILGLEEYDKPYEQYVNNISVEQLWPRVFIKYTEEDAKTLSIIDTDVGSIIGAKFAEWISSGGVEKEWDAYLQELNNAGFQEALEIRQKYYDEFVESLGK